MWLFQAPNKKKKKKKSKQKQKVFHFFLKTFFLKISKGMLEKRKKIKNEHTLRSVTFFAKRARPKKTMEKEVAETKNAAKPFLEGPWTPGFDISESKRMSIDDGLQKFVVPFRQALEKEFLREDLKDCFLNPGLYYTVEVRFKGTVYGLSLFTVGKGGIEGNIAVYQRDGLRGYLLQEQELEGSKTFQDFTSILNELRRIKRLIDQGHMLKLHQKYRKEKGLGFYDIYDRDSLRKHYTGKSDPESDVDPTLWTVVDIQVALNNARHDWDAPVGKLKLTTTWMSATEQSLPPYEKHMPGRSSPFEMSVIPFFLQGLFFWGKFLKEVSKILKSLLGFSKIFQRVLK
jgi:hypothetical protein